MKTRTFKFTVTIKAKTRMEAEAIYEEAREALPIHGIKTHAGVGKLKETKPNAKPSAS